MSELSVFEPFFRAEASLKVKNVFADFFKCIKDWLKIKK